MRYIFLEASTDVKKIKCSGAEQQVKNNRLIVLESQTTGIHKSYSIHFSTQLYGIRQLKRKKPSELPFSFSINVLASLEINMFPFCRIFLLVTVAHK